MSDRDVDREATQVEGGFSGREMGSGDVMSQKMFMVDDRPPAGQRCGWGRCSHQTAFLGCVRAGILFLRPILFFCEGFRSIGLIGFPFQLGLFFGQPALALFFLLLLAFQFFLSLFKRKIRPCQWAAS